MKQGGKVSEKTFDELSEDEKIRIVEPSYLEKTSPTQADIDKWKDAKIYGIWINNKRVPNSELSKYKPNDFCSFF